MRSSCRVLGWLRLPWLSGLNGEDTGWLNEKAILAALAPAGSPAGLRNRVTRTLGMRTSLIPAPAWPATTLFAPVMVMRNQLLWPARTCNVCALAVLTMSVLAAPAAVVTRSLLAIACP